MNGFKEKYNGYLIDSFNKLAYCETYNTKDKIEILKDIFKKCNEKMSYNLTTFTTNTGFGYYTSERYHDSDLKEGSISDTIRKMAVETQRDNVKLDGLYYKGILYVVNGVDDKIVGQIVFFQREDPAIFGIKNATVAKFNDKKESHYQLCKRTMSDDKIFNELDFFHSKEVNLESAKRRADKVAGPDSPDNIFRDFFYSQFQSDIAKAEAHQNVYMYQQYTNTFDKEKKDKVAPNSALYNDYIVGPIFEKANPDKFKEAIRIYEANGYKVQIVNEKRFLVKDVEPYGFKMDIPVTVTDEHVYCNGFTYQLDVIPYCQFMVKTGLNKLLGKDLSSTIYRIEFQNKSLEDFFTPDELEKIKKEKEMISKEETKE